MTRRHIETNTIQLWPSGVSVTYRGDPHGPENQRSIRSERREAAGEPRTGHWRKGSPEEWTKIRIEVHARMYGERDILHCDSALVDELIKSSADGHQELGGFTIDDMRNLTPDTSTWTIEQCLQYANEHTSDPIPERRATPPASDEIPAFEADDDASYLEALQDFIHERIEPAEVYEWWRVSSWLCEQLHAIGEVTIDNDYGYWWGRTCTGQGWIMDGVLQRVAAKHED